MDRITRLNPKRVVVRSTNLMIRWFDSTNEWDSSVGIEPLAADARPGLIGLRPNIPD